MPPWAWIGARKGCTTFGVGPGGSRGGEVLGHRAAGDGEAVAVQDASSRSMRNERRAPPPMRSRSVMW